MYICKKYKKNSDSRIMNNDTVLTKSHHQVINVNSYSRLFIFIYIIRMYKYIFMSIIHLL